MAVANAQVLAIGAKGGRVPRGIYHLTAGGQTSWYGFAAAIRAALPGSPGKAHLVARLRR